MTFSSHLQYLNGSLFKSLRSLKVYFRAVIDTLNTCPISLCTLVSLFNLCCSSPVSKEIHFYMAILNACCLLNLSSYLITLVYFPQFPSFTNSIYLYRSVLSIGTVNNKNAIFLLPILCLWSMAPTKSFYSINIACSTCPTISYSYIFRVSKFYFLLIFDSACSLNKGLMYLCAECRSSTGVGFHDDLLFTVHFTLKYVFQ